MRKVPGAVRNGPGTLRCSRAPPTPRHAPKPPLRTLSSRASTRRPSEMPSGRPPVRSRDAPASAWRWRQSRPGNGRKPVRQVDAPPGSPYDGLGGRPLVRSRYRALGQQVYRHLVAVTVMDDLRGLFGRDLARSLLTRVLQQRPDGNCGSLAALPICRSRSPGTPGRDAAVQVRCGAVRASALRTTASTASSLSPRSRATAS